MKIIDINHTLNFPESKTNCWTTIIAAAGRGSRLGFSKPKILYELNGKTILEILIEKFKYLSNNIVIVASPEGFPFIRKEVEKLNINQQIRFVIQKVPTGMADAIEIALNLVNTKYLNIIWGDQVGITPQTINYCNKYFESQKESIKFCLPLVNVENPYIHFSIDSNNILHKVLQKREGDEMPQNGYSDCGFFCFRTIDIKFLLSKNLNSIGNQTKERNFISLLPILENGAHDYNTGILLNNLSESIGINSPDDVKKYLKTNN
jgi:bifunctional UDP-N-acetylglucosamine pyrophosphorylase/glucosamine-1-phosphate N-acetyltransferase